MPGGVARTMNCEPHRSGGGDHSKPAAVRRSRRSAGSSRLRRRVSATLGGGWVEGGGLGCGGRGEEGGTASGCAGWGRGEEGGGVEAG
jgi:hypothetical protein